MAFSSCLLVVGSSPLPSKGEESGAKVEEPDGKGEEFLSVDGDPLPSLSGATAENKSCCGAIAVGSRYRVQRR